MNEIAEIQQDQRVKPVIFVRVTPDLKEQIKSHCDRIGSNQSAFVNQIIRQYFENRAND